jgi:hypothetical protein
MTTPSLSSLLARWEEASLRGQELSPNDLCPDRPDVADELARAIDGLRRMGGSSGLPSPPPDEATPRTRTWSGEIAADADPFPGEYRLQHKLGEGAFGAVWLALDLRLDAPVAFKSVSRFRLDRGSSRRLDALLHEARIMFTLRHRHIVQVYTVRETAVAVYLVLQYVRGGSLADRVAKEGKPLDWEAAARYVADVGEGLMAVHERGLIHRDVKPANVLWDPETDEALLTDFGIAARLTDPGEIAGTIPFMAPEVMRGQIGQAADTYSLAATLFWLITGQVPFRPPSGVDPHSQLRSMLQAIEVGLPNSDPRFADLPRPLEHLIRASLSADERSRPPLCDFVASLRGDLNRLMADSLVAPGDAGASAEIDLRVSRQAGGCWERVAATAPSRDGVTRNFKKVPKGPEQVRLRTGDRVRVEVRASQAGFVTVFNVGPTGDLTVLYPDDAGAPGHEPTTPAGQWLHVVDVDLEPPTGRERLFAVWTRGPLAVTPEQLRALAEEKPPPPAYRATRNMAKVKRLVQGLPPDERRVAVLEVDHFA